jgi:hypothetical protein
MRFKKRLPAPFSVPYYEIMFWFFSFDFYLVDFLLSRLLLLQYGHHRSLFGMGDSCEPASDTE